MFLYFHTHTYLLLAECEVRTASYGPSFYPKTYGLKKNKIAIFQKKTRKSTLENYDFMINNKTTEIVNYCTYYLGVNFSSNGSLIRHKEKLQEKTRRSIFAFRRYLYPSKLSVNVCNKLINALFLPILTYSSEVWGAYDKNENTTWGKGHNR